MAWNKRDRAQLGEQSPNDEDVRADARNRDVSSEHRGQPVERETIGQRGSPRQIDTTAGDEGIDESNFAGGDKGSQRGGSRGTERSASSSQQRSGSSSEEHSGSSSSERTSSSGTQSLPGKAASGREREADQGAHRMAGNQPGTIEQAGASVRGRELPGEDAFAGQGGQKGGAPAKELREGTGYTSDRRGQLQEDDSLGGSQGRHGRSGSRHGMSGNPQTGTSEKERVGGQTAQNPRIPRRDDD